MIYLLLFFLMKALRPDGFGVDTNLWETLNLLILIVGCLHYLPIRSMTLHYTPLKNKGFLWFFVFLLLFLVSLWRSNDFASSSVGIVKDTITLLLVVVMVYLYQQYLFQRQRPFSKLVLSALLHAIGIFCILNLVAVALHPMYGPGGATTLAIIGLQTKKLIFTMYPTVHPNYVGMMGGFLFVMSIERSLFGPGFYGKLIQWVYLASGIIVVLICDARTTLSAALLSILVVIFLKNTKRLSLMKYSVLLVPFSNVLFIVALQFIATFSTVQSISRDSNDLATGNSRKFIYQAAVNELSEFKPVHLIGYGEYGPYGSGITRYYMRYFGIDDEETILNASVAHNTALQVIFDMGYLGLLAFSMLLYFAMHYATKLYRRGHHEYLALLTFFLFNIVAGFTTSRFGNYHEVANQLFIIFCFIIFSAYNYDRLKQEEKDNIRVRRNGRAIPKAQPVTV